MVAVMHDGAFADALISEVSNRKIQVAVYSTIPSTYKVYINGVAADIIYPFSWSGNDSYSVWIIPRKVVYPRDGTKMPAGTPEQVRAAEIRDNEIWEKWFCWRRNVRQDQTIFPDCNRYLWRYANHQSAKQRQQQKRKYWVKT